MESDKLIYWMTLGVLAVATISGLATGHQGWGDRLADRSIAMMAQASGAATNYVEMAGLVLGREEDSEDSSPALINIQDDVQNDVQDEIGLRLACAERILVKRQAQLARLQALKVQVRMFERVTSYDCLGESQYCRRSPAAARNCSALSNHEPRRGGCPHPPGGAQLRNFS